MSVSSATSRITILTSHLTTSHDLASYDTAGKLTGSLDNKRIHCNRCSNTQALYCCITLRLYLCNKCHMETLKLSTSPNKLHRFKVSEMKSYIYFNKDKKENESDVRRSWLTLKNGLLTIEKLESKTLFDLFMNNAKKNLNRNFLGRRILKADGTIGPYVHITYKEAVTRVTHLSSALASLGHNAGDRIGFYSMNRPEWVIAEQACYGQNLCTVPLYDTLGADAAEYILRQAEVSTVFCTRDKVPILISISQTGRCPSLKTIIVFPLQPWDKPGNNTIDFNAGLTVKSLEEMERKGKDVPVPFRRPGPKDMCTFCYTSGTTGDPKGAMLSHGNLACDVASSLQIPGFDYSSNEVHISFLPLAHIFERLCISMVVSVGACANFSRGDVTLLLDDISEAKPTVFVGVPRVYNKVYDKVFAQVAQAGGLSKWLFETAYKSKQSNITDNNDINHWLWDRLVFSKTRNVFGPQLRLACTGSAPISAKVLEFFRIAMSSSIVEGYGMTESTGASTVTEVSDNTSAGHVGTPLTLCEVKLVDVPDMGYLSTDKIQGVPAPRGEICMRGDNIFCGYYKMEDKTKEAIDSDGWLHSGDIGVFLPNGDLKIIDRKKNLFKLAQGEYVAPEKIEQVYQHAPSIAQCFAYGDSLQNELVAIIVPDPETIKPWAKKNNIPGEMKDLCKRPEVRAMILSDMDKEGKKSKLRGFEIIKHFHIESELFSVENGLMTPTMKLKRNEIQQKYVKEFASMYKAIALENEKKKSNL